LCDFICVRKIIERESYANGSVGLEELVILVFLSTCSTFAETGLPYYFVDISRAHARVRCGQG
jgi:hypothetical protein